MELQPSLERRRPVGRGWWSLDVTELTIQVKFAIPMVLTNASYYIIPLISVMFAGRLGDVELAGSTLANSWAVVTAFAVATGLSGSLETLCGQNYGAKQFGMLGLHLQASIIISFLFSIPISMLWIYSKPLLLLLHQDPETSRMASIYLRYLIPGIFAYAFLQCMLRFLQTQGAFVPLAVCSLLPLVLHVGLSYLTVHVWGLGYIGAPLSAGISLWISLFMLVFYVHSSTRFRFTWQGPSMECFDLVLPNLRLALPSAVMVCLEFWAFEVLVLLAGLLPDSQTSTSVIAMCVATEAVVYTIIFGFAAVISTRVSNELGDGNADGAKNAIATTLQLSIATAALIILMLLLGHNIWAKLFSQSILINAEFAKMTPLLATSLLLDSAQGILSGVARGCGCQHLAAWTNLGCFYIIGTPLSVILGFVFGLHDKGLWIGLICGLFCQTCTLVLITFRTDWNGLQLFVDRKESDPLLVK